MGFQHRNGIEPLQPAQATPGDPAEPADRAGTNDRGPGGDIQNPVGTTGSFTPGHD